MLYLLIKVGLVITNVEEEDSSFRVGDLVSNVNQESISDINKLEELYENAKKSEKQNILLLIERGDSSMFVPLSVM